MSKTMNIPSEIFKECVGPYLKPVDWKALASAKIYENDLKIIFTPVKRAFFVRTGSKSEKIIEIY